MATPPPVTAAEATAAVQRIIDRHRQVDDPELWKLEEDPAAVLQFLQRQRGGLPSWVVEQDLLDGLVLRVRLWWMGEEAELWLLERAHRLEVPARLVGRALGVRSRQGVHDRLRLARRKIARLRGEPERRSADDPPDQTLRAAEIQWLRSRREEILDIAAVVVAHCHLLDDEQAEWVAEIARDQRGEIVTPGSVQVLRFTIADLSVSASVDALAPEHPLRGAIQRWTALYLTHPRSSTDSPVE
jgi:hypothetical protein